VVCTGLTARDKHALYLQQVEEGRHAIEHAKKRHTKLVEDTTIELSEALRHSKVPLIFQLIYMLFLIYFSPVIPCHKTPHPMQVSTQI
jgi:uncharacterized membrane protein